MYYITLTIYDTHYSVVSERDKKSMSSIETHIFSSCRIHVMCAQISIAQHKTVEWKDVWRREKNENVTSNVLHWIVHVSPSHPWTLSSLKLMARDSHTISLFGRRHKSTSFRRWLYVTETSKQFKNGKTTFIVFLVAPKQMKSLIWFNWILSNSYFFFNERTFSFR